MKRWPAAAPRIEHRRDGRLAFPDTRHLRSEAVISLYALACCFWIISLPTQRWQPEQASDVHLERSTDKGCMRDVAPRRAGVRLVGMGYELQERLDQHAWCDGETVVHLVGDLRLARLAASGFGKNAVDALRDAGVTSTRLTATPSVSLDRGANAPL
jgi:hypothetical protein